MEWVFGKLCKGMENTVGIEGMVVIMVVEVMVFHPRAKRGLTYAGYLSSKMVQGLLF